MQLSLNFLPIPQPANPLIRLLPAQHAELVEVLARIIGKAAGKPPVNEPAAAPSASKGAQS